MQKPRITVLMPVFNGSKYLRPAIESILEQSFTDFEFLIIDDGSTDNSLEICRTYSDARMRIVENGKNLGLIDTLNKGLSIARGKYIARMDCDDISAPRRLEKQFLFMEENPELGGCGTWFERIGNGKHTIHRFPKGNDDIKFCLVFDNAFLHSSMLLRTAFLEEYGLRYDRGYTHAEDYEFWVRCISHARFVNLPEALVQYRYHEGNVSHKFSSEQRESADRVRVGYLASLNISCDEDDLELHQSIARFQFGGDVARLRRAGQWLEKLAIEAGERCGLSQSAAYRHLVPYWYGACGRSAGSGWRVWRLFLSSPMGRAAEWEWQWKMFLRCALKKSIPGP
jgi:glycosyltransferase involved in cell wall biosynthesis